MIGNQYPLAQCFAKSAHIIPSWPLAVKRNPAPSHLQYHEGLEILQLELRRPDNVRNVSVTLQLYIYCTISLYDQIAMSLCINACHAGYGTRTSFAGAALPPLTLRVTRAVRVTRARTICVVPHTLACGTRLQHTLLACGFSKPVPHLNAICKRAARSDSELNKDGCCVGPIYAWHATPIYPSMHRDIDTYMLPQHQFSLKAWSPS